MGVSTLPLTAAPAPVQIPKKVQYTLYSTPTAAIVPMLDVLNPQPWQTIYDLGCGDARILIAAVQRYGCSAVGVEINPETVKIAKQKVAEAGLSDKIEIVQDDVTTYQRLDEADLITMYLYEPTIRRLLPRFRRLRPGTKVLSYMHPMPGINAQLTSCSIGSVDHKFYVYQVPVPAPTPTPVVDKPQSAQPQAPADCEVVLYVAANCPPCERAKLRDLPILKRLGVRTKIVTRHRYRVTPSYTLIRGRRSKVVVGRYLTHGQILRELRALPAP